MNWVAKQEEFKKHFGFTPEIPTPGATRARFEKEAVYLVMAGLARRALTAQQQQCTEQGSSILKEGRVDASLLLQIK